MSRFGRPVSAAGLYYTHGLFCASYPGTVLVLVSVAVIACSLPFFITSTGDLNTPKPWRSPWLNYRVPTKDDNVGTAQWVINNATQLSERTPSWFLGLPVAVIQQLYVNVEVTCNHPTKPPLCQKYSIGRKTAAHLLEQMKETIGVCSPVMHPAAIKFANSLNASEGDRPSTSSGVLSPSLDSIRSKWEEEEQSLGYHSTKELLYGGFWEREHRHRSQDSGSTRTHTFAVTFLLEANRERFPALSNCVQSIRNHWPSPDPNFQSTFMKHFYYEPEWHLMDFAYLIGVYFIVFLYISFSVGKIDLVKSKFGLGFTAFLTVIASLTMSLGICTFFGLSSVSLSGSEIYPFMVVVFGLENILIIVKAVMSTPEEFDVKYRIATGLYNQGGNITRSVITLALMLTVGIAIFNYMIKEFCIIALVGLLCDWFLQLTFFPTCLSIDLRRLELTDLGSAAVAIQQAAGEGALDPPPRPCPSSLQMITPLRWNSKRVKFAYFLANARIASRAFMVVLFAYLIACFLHTEFFHTMVGMNPVNHTPTSLPAAPSDPLFDEGPTVRDLHNLEENLASDGPDTLISSETPSRSHSDDRAKKGFLWQDLLDISNGRIEIFPSGEEDGFSVMCEEDMCWRAMVTTHWPKLLRYYGYQMESRFLTLLPPISLTLHLGSKDRDHPSSSLPTFLHTLYDPIVRTLSNPTTIRAYFVAAAIVTIVMYFLVLIRASEMRHRRHMESVIRRQYSVRVGHLRGHRQDIECLCVDGGLVVSAGLEGNIRVWDPSPMKRRCVMEIARSEICGEPPEVAATSDRDEADGCEADTEPQNANSKPSQPSQGGRKLSSAAGGSDTTVPGPGTPLSNRQLWTDSRNAPSPQTSHLESINSKSTPVQAAMHFSSSSSPLPIYTPPPSPHPGTSHLYRRISDTSVVHTTSSGMALSSQNAPSYPGVPQPIPFSTHTASYPSVPASPQPLSRPPSVQGMPYDGPNSRHRRAPSGSSLHNVSAISVSPLPGKASLPSYTYTHTPHHPPSPPMSPSTLTTGPSSTTITMLPSQTQSRPPLLARPRASSHQRSKSATTIPQVRVQSNMLQTAPPTDIQLLSGTCTTQSHTGCLSSTSQKESCLPNRYRRQRGHLRSSSLGTVAYRPTHSSDPWSPLSASTSLASLSRLLLPRNESLGNLSNASTISETAFSTTSGNLFDKQPSQTPNPDEGYDFSRHFNLFSQFTSNMALQYCSRKSEDVPRCKAPAVWCMDMKNKVIAVGCGNGQVEAWNALSGSLMFCRSVAPSGVTTIAVHTTGVISGHMDGSLHLIGHSGIPQHSIRAHRKPISVMRCTGDRVVTGGYDAAVKVHRIPDFFCVNSVFIHNGGITALAMVEPQAQGCVSGCSSGLVCYWELNSGNCLHEFEEYGNPVLRLDSTSRKIVALFSEECIRVWETSGTLLTTIELDGPCHSFTMLAEKHIVTSLESHIVIYDVETGEKLSKKLVELQDRGVALIRHINALDSAHIVCSVGRDLQVIPCNLKLKID